MSKKHKPKVDRNEKAKAEYKAKKVEQMPMNKDFLLAKDDKGNPKYPIVDKLIKYKQLDFERVLDLMRQIGAFVYQIKHHKNRLNRLKMELASGVIKETDKYGRILEKEEVESEIINSQLYIPRELSRIRESAVDKLLPLVDGVRFSGEDYNSYILKVNKAVNDLGYELFPQKLELIFPEI